MEYLILFWEYFKVGLFTIGGGYAMLPMVTQMMQTRGWLTQQELIDFIGIAESTPGPFAINLATFVGLNVGESTGLGFFGGILGAIVATTAVVLPSVVIIIIVTNLFTKFKTSKSVQGVLYGMQPVVVGLILSAVVTVTGSIVLPNLDFKSPSADSFDVFNWISLLIIVAFIPISRMKIKGKKIHPILMIVSSAVIGILVFGVFGVQQ